MDVIAKFYVYAVTRFTGGSVKVELSPVIDGSEENKLFWKATPSGKIEMQINNPLAAELFEVGKSYFVTFKEA